MKKEIDKVLFVGLGGIGQRHLRNLKAIKGEKVQVFAYRRKNAKFVLDNRLEIVENSELNEHFEITCVNSLQEAFQQGIKTVFICNPTSMHKDVLLQSLKAGCDVFIEKPIADNMDKFEEIEEILQRNGNIVFVGYQHRYHPCIIQTKALLDNNEIGSILSVRAEIGECVKTWHKYEDYRKMYACRSDLGGGVLITQIHELDYIYYLFGMPKSVYAIGGKLSDLEIDVEDTVDILMEYDINEKTVPISVHQDYIQNPARRVCQIIGTKGKIEFDLLTHTTTVYDEIGKIKSYCAYEFERNDMFMQEMKSFFDSIENNHDSQISFEEGKRSLEIAMAAKESMRTKEPVQIRK